MSWDVSHRIFPISLVLLRGTLEEDQHQHPSNIAKNVFLDLQRGHKLQQNSESERHSLEKYGDTYITRNRMNFCGNCKNCQNLLLCMHGLYCTRLVCI